MKGIVELDGIYAPSEDIVAREIEGEIVIVPLVSGIGDMEDELYYLSETGRPVWRKLDGKRTLREAVREAARELEAEYDAPAEVIEREVIELIEDLVTKRMVVRKG